MVPGFRGETKRSLCADMLFGVGFALRVESEFKATFSVSLLRASPHVAPPFDMIFNHVKRPVE
jgi:hypothetical protein